MDTFPSDSSPVGYSHGHHPSVLAAHSTRTAANSCSYVLDRIRPGMRVLDIGCGPGSITLDLAELVSPQGEVIGIDFSAEAIASAQAAAAARGDRRTLFLVGDALDAGAELGLFDIVHAHQVLQHMPDPVAGLRSMSQLCAPSGIIAVRDADYGAMAWFPEAPGFDRWREVYSASARADGAEPNAGRRLRAWANAAGPKRLWAGSSNWTYTASEQTVWWARSQAERIRSSRFAAKANEQGLSPAEIEELAQAWEEWGRSRDAWFLLPSGELIAAPGA